MPEQIKEQWNWRLIPKIVTPALLVALITISINIGKGIAEIKAVTFDSPQQKARVLEAMENHIGEVEIYKGFYRITMLEKENAGLKKEIVVLKDEIQEVRKTQAVQTATLLRIERNIKK